MLESKREKHRDDTIENYQLAGQGADTAPIAKFPAKYYKKDKLDDEFYIRQKLVELNKQGKGLGQPVLDERAFDWLEKKRKEVEWHDFEDWALRTFVSQTGKAYDPVRYSGLLRILPGIREKREEWIDTQAELQKRLAKLRLKKFEELTQEDLIFIYAILKGDIVIHKSPVYKPEEYNAAVEETRVARGLLNPMRWAEYPSEPKVPKEVLDVLSGVTGDNQSQLPTPIGDPSGVLEKILALKAGIRSKPVNPVKGL
jgi:hypothetical protein